MDDCNRNDKSGGLWGIRISVWFMVLGLFLVCVLLLTISHHRADPPVLASKPHLSEASLIHLDVHSSSKTGQTEKIAVEQFAKIASDEIILSANDQSSLAIPGPPLAVHEENPVHSEAGALDKYQQPIRDTNWSRLTCMTNLHKIFEAAILVGNRTEPKRLPVDLVLLRSEFTNASVFLCPSDPDAAVRPVAWEFFSPQFISYRFHLDILHGKREMRIGIDYPYLRCPFHNLRLTGNNHIMTDRSGPRSYGE